MPLYKQAQRDEYLYRDLLLHAFLNSVLEMSRHFYITVSLPPGKNVVLPAWVGLPIAGPNIVGKNETSAPDGGRTPISR